MPAVPRSTGHGKTPARPRPAPGKPRQRQGPGSPEHATRDPVLEQRAAEDDPRRWGDADDDLGDWLKSQRPPHWD